MSSFIMLKDKHGRQVVSNCTKSVFNVLVGAEVNAIEKPCMTPLHSAAGHGWTHLVNLLIQNKADVNILDR